MKFVNLGQIQWTASPGRKFCNDKLLICPWSCYSIWFYTSQYGFFTVSLSKVDVEVGGDESLWIYVKDCLWTSCLKLIRQNAWLPLATLLQKKVLNLRRGLVIWKPSGFFLLILCMTFLVNKSIPFLSGRLTAQPQALRFVSSDTFSESTAMG